MEARHRHTGRQGAKRRADEKCSGRRAQMTAAFARTLPFGATYLGDNRTRFRLWAPGQTTMGVEIDHRHPLAMERQADGWFELETSCGPGTSYVYRLSTGQAVPDPAS